MAPACQVAGQGSGILGHPGRPGVGHGEHRLDHDVLVHGHAVNRLRSCVGPEDIHIDRPRVGAKPEVERQVIHVAFPRAGFHLAGDDEPSPEVDSRLRPDGGTIHGGAVTLESDFQPVIGVALVVEELAVRHEIQEPVAVEIRPGRLVGRQ